jgi:aminoglycoside phosphotransferase (APT) family kinase protein
VLRALEATPVPAPAVVAVCEDEAVIGAPFYLMEEVAGAVLGARLPGTGAAAGDGEVPSDAAEAVADAVVEQLVAIHSVPLTGEVAELGHGEGYLERQVRRFGELLPANAARPLPQLEEVGAWLARNRPASAAATVVHGDYRLGNLFFDPAAPRVTAVLDWEMATLGDPLADLGYLTAMWAEPGDEPNPMLSLCPLTQGAGFPGRGDLARRYAERTGADLGALRWYQVLAVWKSAIFLEGSFKRYRAGLSDDAFFAALDEGVPALARWAGRLIAGDGVSGDAPLARIAAEVRPFRIYDGPIETHLWTIARREVRAVTEPRAASAARP